MTKRTGEGRPIDKVEQRLNPTPMRIKQVLKWLLKNGWIVVSLRHRGFLFHMKILPASQPSAQMPAHAMHC